MNGFCSWCAFLGLLWVLSACNLLLSVMLMVFQFLVYTVFMVLLLVSPLVICLVHVFLRIGEVFSVKTRCPI